MKSKEPLKLTLTERFKKSALELDPKIRETLKKQIARLASDPRHPSLRVKKIRGTRSIFEARVNQAVRFTFEYGGKHEIILRVVGHHDPTLKKP
jgi:mRNA-degrading endonuclease RelE of RelBE toxin-antitoxin system